MRHVLSLAAAALALQAGLASAQTVNPNDPNSASGGVLAQNTAPSAAAGTPGAPTRDPSQSGAAGVTSPGGAASATPAAMPRMAEGQIRDALRAAGYTDLQGLEREGGGNFRVREARRWGERVENLVVDASTGGVTNAAPMNERQIRAMLREIGWTNIRDYREEGQYVRVRAERNNREQDLRIDPRVGILDQPGQGR